MNAGLLCLTDLPYPPSLVSTLSDGKQTTHEQWQLHTTQAEGGHHTANAHGRQFPAQSVWQRTHTNVAFF